MGKKYDSKYILGLDIGISSVGWGMLELDSNDNPFRIIDVGSRIFTPGEIEKTGDSRAKDRREKRDARRVIRRREFRVDRVRNLLYDNHLLIGNITSNIPSVKNEELTIIYNNMINSYYHSKNTNPYKLKVEALDRKLTPEELCIILVHYAKKRGYKSNREDSSDSENGKVLSAINENASLMKTKEYRTVSEMYVKDEKFKNKIKNSPGNYKVSVTNEMYQEEIEKVLNKQITYGLIDEKFKEEYLTIWSSRRHYASGPGFYYEYDDNGNRLKKISPYGGNLIEKMVGKCTFDGNPRAPKRAFSSEMFISLTKLLNLRYRSDENIEYIGLTKNEIKELIDISINKNKVTYNDIVKLLNQNNIKFKDLQLTKNSYIKVIEELKKKLNIPKENKVDINELSDSEKQLYNEIYKKELYNNIIIELKGYHELRQVIEKSFGKEYWEKAKDNILLLDKLALLCTNYKVNDDIKNHMLSSEDIPKELVDDNFILLLPNFKDHIMLSTEIIRKLLPLMLEGKRYDEAMSELGYDSTNNHKNCEKKDLLVPINVANNITNQRVVRSLTQARKVINSIIKKYGTPKMINIETARELAKTRQERNEIEKRQKEKKIENDKIKEHLVELGLFSSPDKINGNDLLKYKLWQEQKEFCSYSLKKITIDDLFGNNIVQIDHILPYSRTYNDNYLNKTLVFAKENQDKGNKTPYEWFGNTVKWDEYESFINNLNIPQNKKDNYLLRKLDDDIEKEMKEQNLNDTKYISRELSSLIKAYLNVEKVNVYQGAITAKLRSRWGFNRLTHSYISANYIMPTKFKEGINKDRDNHLHHAMDALVIASITPSLQQKVILYEKFSRYIDGLTQKQLANINYQEIEANNAIYYNDKTGEIDEISLKEYLRRELEKEHIYYHKHNIAKLKFPLPYEKFVEEAKIRVYEQNLDTLKWQLSSFHTYTKEDISKIRTLTPSIAKNKISGKMHEETYYGIKKVGNTTYKTIRKSLENIKRSDLENIPDKKGGSKDIYNTILAWFGDCQTGEEALKLHNGKYPISQNDKENKEIKKIKVYSEYKNTGHIINGSNVEKGGIYKIDVLKSKEPEDEKLYFAAYDILEINKIKAINSGSKEDFNIKLDYGQSKNNIILSYSNMLKNFDILCSLYKNDLVDITLRNGKQSTAYIVGCSSGMLEVKSKLGDGYDIIGENSLFNKERAQYQITVSTIKSIKKLSISILGEINGV